MQKKMTISEVVAYFKANTTKKNGKVTNVFGGHKVSIECLVDYGKRFNLTNAKGETIDPKFGSKKSKNNPNGGKHIRKHYKVTFNFAENYDKWLQKNEGRTAGDGANNGHKDGIWHIDSVIFQYANGNVTMQYLPNSKAFESIFSHLEFEDGTELTESEVVYLKQFTKPSDVSYDFRNVSLSNVLRMWIEGDVIEVVKD